jgi:hypothetical protein
MSAWRNIVSELHRRGGGPLLRVQFDVDVHVHDKGIRSAKYLGLVEHVGDCLWQLTPKGRDLAEGRLVIARAGGGAPVKFVASWAGPLL